jgi:hypothetical protein
VAPAGKTPEDGDEPEEVKGTPEGGCQGRARRVIGRSTFKNYLRQLLACHVSPIPHVHIGWYFPIYTFMLYQVQKKEANLLMSISY